MAETKHYIHKYETEAINNDGVNGVAYIPNGLAVAVSHPLKDAPGTNPEQLLGLSLSTCMSATLEAIEKENGLPHLAEVHVHVSMVKSTDGLDFLVTARIHIPNISHAQAVDFVHQAEHRCPVSKLLSNSANYTIEVVDSFDD
ncbi:MAG TPA: dihydroneopterin aldolase [Lactobacillus sp.]|uniref:OsmC/Ohr family protein n=1 Tax=Secundilactobacillus silagincola TaxID=1714681 RepID=A0A1Z5J504_9LACO|nr:OsmC family protein [Secundilactobacillus silagincola]GAX08902.1 OsmC/Ohr family protein [Secundilactobacillus silagincola]HBF73938.1 dihydroneopterin aldolase [Lactobacillus sp.]